MRFDPMHAWAVSIAQPSTGNSTPPRSRSFRRNWRTHRGERKMSVHAKPEWIGHAQFRLKRLLLTSPLVGEVDAHRQMRGG